ncbi:hypothetical protein SDC9_29890 [bioreactor metagenome]|uniref:Uncharacterized protein n=1 Tax=bioreactor metagenome TaxID=1076179 RepID=A0A644UYD5_9ZZZZ
MGVQQHPCRRYTAVDRAVHGPGRGIGRVRAGHHLGVTRIQQQQIRSPHLAEMLPFRVHQELHAIGRDCGAEVVADRLGPAESIGDPEGRGQIHAQRLKPRLVHRRDRLACPIHHRPHSFSCPSRRSRRADNISLPCKARGPAHFRIRPREHG